MKSVLSFYKDVYKAELSHSKHLHLDSTRILKKYIISSKEELLTGEYPSIPIDERIGEEIVKTLELRGDKVGLKYFSGARISKFKSLNKFETTRVYPLISFDANIDLLENGCFISLQLDSKKAINSSLARSIINDPIFKKISLTKGVDLHFQFKLKELVEKHMPHVHTDEMVMFPELWTKQQISKEKKLPFIASDKIIPFGTLCIVERENDQFSTMDELTKLEKVSSFSAPLNVLFDQENNYSDEKKGILCEELNQSQDLAIDITNERVLSFISGPPGTGKSFTISNLAVEKISKGQSVLITSKNKEALNVIEEKIKHQLNLPDIFVNATRDKQLMGLKNKLNHYLGRKHIALPREWKELENKFHEFQEFHDAKEAFENKLVKTLELEKQYFKKILHKKLSKNLTKEYKDRILQARSIYTTPLWINLNDYYKHIEKTRIQGRKLIRAVNEFVRDNTIIENRTELREYLKFLRSRNKEWKKSKEELIDFSNVLKTFPIWLVQANEISKALSLQKEIFDILIIDEASQCDIPSLIPLMYRAKKCVIVGDANQLTHISFITKNLENSLKYKVSKDKRFLCKHRGYSILDLTENVLDSSAKIQLNEHFRSDFPIISFSNEKFYENNLNVLTKRPTNQIKSIEFKKTKGLRRNKSNQIEIEKITNEIRMIVDKQLELDKKFKYTIGVLSPFRVQVDRLFNSIRDNFSVKEIKDHDIMVGTAFSFQGNERDTMFISFCLDTETKAGSFNFLNRKDVFNVSMTRARSKQIIYYSFNEEKLNQSTVLADFFRHYKHYENLEKRIKVKDTFCEEVVDSLPKNQIKTWPSFEISGLKIDLLISKKNTYVGIDLIGFPGEYEDYYSIERYKMLERSGIKLFPLSYAYWLTNKSECLEQLYKLLD